MKMITIPCELQLECNLRTRGVKGSSSPLPNFKFRNGNVGYGSHLSVSLGVCTRQCFQSYTTGQTAQGNIHTCACFIIWIWWRTYNAGHLPSAITVSSEELIQASSLLASWPKQKVHLWPHLSVPVALPPPSMALFLTLSLPTVIKQNC